MFETPVYTMIIPGHAEMDRDLRQAILSRRAAESGVSISNVGGWQSRSDLLGWGGEAAAQLARHVADLVSRVVVGSDGAQDRASGWQCEMWANVNEAGDSNQNHWHPGSYLSAVYYVDHGYGRSDDRALGGELVFIDPRMPFLRMRTPDLRHRGAGATVDEHETWVRPRAGLLLAFPSFLGHSVRAYRGDGTRISVAINMVVQNADN